MTDTAVLPKPSANPPTVAEGDSKATVKDSGTSRASRVNDDAFLIDELTTDARIMVVDDEAVNVSVVVKYLRNCGYKDFITTTDPRRVKRLLRETKPDLLLLDIMMPETNGLDLLQQIRTSEKSCYLPVIILTAYCDPRNRCEALERGATDFLAKPVDPNELIPRVRNVLAAKVRRDDLLHYTQRLEREIQESAEALVRARHEAERRYLAGKAEIATDVLHNVGNALHSVNVATDLIDYTLSESRLPALKRLAELLLANSKRIGRFMRKDRRGRALPAYLDELADELSNERTVSLRELALLKKHLKHIRAVVATQQKYAKQCNVDETVSLSELISDADELFGSGGAKPRVQIEYDLTQAPSVKTDRNKLLQVVVNVLKNAIESSSEANGPDLGRVNVRLGVNDSNRAFIEIRDNGMGISQEDMAKIFVHGFTTKTNGNGFGLHSCANIMRELGGTIEVDSGGLKKGAVFTLTLPLEHKSGRAAK